MSPRRWRRWGSHLAITSRSSVPTCRGSRSPTYGILKAGAVVVPLNVLLKPREIAYHLKDSDAKALLAFEGTAELPLAAMAQAACDEAGCQQLLVMTLAPDAPSPVRRRATLTQADARGGSRAVPDAPAAHGRHRGHPLHLGHDRPPQGRRADAREHAAQRRRQPRHVSCRRFAAAWNRTSRSSRCRCSTRRRRPA